MTEPIKEKMKKTLLALAFVSSLLPNVLNAQSVDWYYATDGVDPVWTWEYKDVYLPAGTQVDSVYCGFRRPGYSDDTHDCIFAISSGSIFVHGSSTGPWSYSSVNTSLYNHWIDLTSFNYTGESMIRVALPVPTAIFDSLGIATSSLGLGVSEVTDRIALSIYPNPANQSITILSESYEDILIMNLLGSIVLQVEKKGKNITIDVSDVPSGTYFIRQGNNVTKFIKK